MGLFGLFKPNVEKMERKRDVKGLIKALKHKDYDVRKGAEAALVRIGEPAVESLIRALEYKDSHPFYLRRGTLRALGEIKDTRAVEPLIQTLLKDESWDARALAAEALGKIKDSRAVEPLTQALNSFAPYSSLKHECWLLRSGAAEALGRIGDARAAQPLVEALIFNRPRRALAVTAQREEEEKVVEALAKIGKPAVEALIQAFREKYYTRTYINELGTPTEKCDTRPCVAKALIRIGEPAVEPLIQTLKDEDRDCIPSAAEALGRIGDARAVEPLIQALKDENRNVRRRVVEALGGIGDARAVEPLIQTLLEDGRWLDVRAAAAEALAKIKDARAIEPLIKALKEPLIHAMKDEEEMSEFELHQRWEDINVRMVVAKALGRIREPRTAEFLINWLFKPPRIIGNVGELSSWVEAMSDLFGDYADLILKASVYVTVETESPGRGPWHHDLQESDEAIRKLCNVHTQISNNILHKVSQKEDIKVLTGTLEDDWYGELHHEYETLSFQSQRNMAKKELERRGNPPYDASAYLNKEAWKL